MSYLFCKEIDRIYDRKTGKQFSKILLLSKNNPKLSAEFFIPFDKYEALESFLEDNVNLEESYETIESLSELLNQCPFLTFELPQLA